MNRIPSRRATLLAALLSCLFLPAVFLAQGTGPKALVVCPPTDAAGCDRIAAQLALATSGGNPVFPGGVDKKYTELRTMSLSQLQSYSAVFVPSLANAPYGLLRESAVRYRLSQVLRGRVAVWSGTPDRGTTDGASAGKLTLIQNLGRWASAQHATDGSAGLVVLQDFSDPRPDGTSPRYDWIQAIAGVDVAPVTTVRTYSQVEKNNANPAAAAIVGSLAYDNMASFGLAAPGGPGLVGAWGQTVNGKKTSRGEVVLATFARTPPQAFTMTSAGGTITAQGGKVVLVFPAGAVPEPVSVAVSKATVSETGYVLETAYSFDPSMTFAAPVSLTISYLEANIPGGIANESKLQICEYKASAWTPVPGSTVNTAANTVTAPINHFSRYAIFVEGCGGGGGGGGGGKGSPTATNDGYTTAEDTPLSVPAPGVLANDTDPNGDPITATLVSGPAQGTLTLNANGSFTYTPAANFSGQVTFTYKANDGRRDSNTATVTITVTPVNDAPVAVNDALSTPEDTPLNVAAPGVLANDTDPDGNPLTAVLVSGPANGTLTLNANGSLVYTPNAGFNGTDQFTYRANDGTTNSNVATVTITVDDVNDAPAAANDAYSTAEDVALNVAAPGVLANDTDPEGSPLTAVLVSGPAQGTLSLNANGSFTYTPAANFSGQATFTYKANDGTSDSNVATVTITVNAVNDAPAAVNDAYTTDEDVALNVPAPGVLANDTDADGGTLTAVLVSGTTHGTLTLNANGSFTYTPAANYNGPDSFTYKANDGTSDSNVATVTITVNGQAEAPVAVNDAYSTDEDTALNVAAPGVLANDTDADGGTLTAVLVSGTTHGTLTLNANGSFTYTPTAGFNGSDQFTYKANDGALDSNVATVTITVATVNDAPVAVNDTYSTDEDVALIRSATQGVLANDTDPENNPLTAVLVSGPAHGTLTLNADGSFTYTPAANYNGPDSFTYKANDGTSDSNVATVALTVNAVVDVPVATNDAYSTNEDTPLSVTAPGVLGNDSNPEGGTLSAVLVAGPAHGTLTLNANGSFTYTPAANYNGPDSFTYKANDGTTDSNVATVTLTINAVVDAPVAVNDAYSTDEDVALNVAAPGVLANDTDPENNPLTSVLVTGPAHGTLTLNANGSFTYTPAANYNGPDSFTYKANDGTTDSNVATVTLTITSVVDVPVATNDSYSTNEDTPLSVTAPGVLGNDSNPEGGTFSAVLVAGPAHGTLTLNANGSFTYTPAANYNGPDSFTYKGNNGSGDSNVATVAITVNPVNDLPTAVADSYTTDEDIALVVAAPGVLANDTDAESSPLTAVLVTGPAHGTLTLNANGSFTYTPAANYFGADAFTYKANDGAGDSNTVTVSITVNPVNDAPVAVADAYNALGNVQAGIPATGVLGNDTDVDDPAANLSVQPATIGSTNGGTVVLSADGSFTYVSAPGYNGSDSFSYTVRDVAGATATGTVTMTVTGTYWFVDAAAPAGGNGTQNSRFQSLTPLGAAGDLDDPGDIILVHSGTYTSAIALEANQQLIGQGIPAALTATVNGQTVTLLATGTAPTIGSTSGNAVTLASGNTLRGFVAGSAPGAAIAGSAVGTLTVADVSINNGSGRALDLTTSGTLSAAFGSISSTGGTGNGINLVGQTGTLTSGSTSITNPSGTGIHVQGSGGFSFGSTTVAKGTTAGTGVHLQSNSGTTTFTSLGITTSGGTGLFANGAGTLSVAAGTISATGGPAIDATSTTLSGAGFSSTSSTGSPGRGISLTGVSGTWSLGTGSIGTAATEDFFVSGGNAGISYAGSITNTANRSVSISGRTGGTVTLSGNISDTGTGILVQNGTGGAVEFTGASKVLSTGANPAVTLATNTGATIRFADSLKIATSTGGGFSATGGGTVTVAGTHNSITSTGGVALNVANTSIGAGGLNFRSISAGNGTADPDPANGIVLNNTGSTAGLTVSGTGSAGTGGTIQNTTGEAVSLTGTVNPSLAWMNVQNSKGSGIRASAVSGLSLSSSLVDNSGDTGGGSEAGILLLNLSGSNQITASTIRNSFEDNIRWTPSSGAQALTLTNTTVGPNNPTSGNSGVNLIGTGTANATLIVSGGTFTQNKSFGIGTSFTDNSAHTVNVSGATFTDNNVAVGLATELNADVTFDIADNPSILRSKTSAILVLAGPGSTSASQVRGRIRGNTVGDNTADSGARDGIGIRVEVNDDADAVVEVTGNTIRHTDQDGIFIQARDPSPADGDPATATADFTVTGNTVGTPDDNTAFPFFSVYGVRVEARHNTTVCLDIAGNTSSGANGTAGFRVRQRDSSAFRLERLTGAANSPANVAAFTAGQNAAGSTASATVATTFTAVADGACRNVP
jgi:VCBS repeat-containing protein